MNHVPSDSAFAVSADGNEQVPVRSGRAALFEKHGTPFEVVRFPVPSPGPGEVLVQVTCGTICGSDVHTWSGRRVEPVPCVLGHEIVGRIAWFGDSHDRIDLAGSCLEVGDRVTWTLAASCGGCFFCRHDLPQKCETLMKYGHVAIAHGREFTGGFADFCVLAPGTGIVRVPDSLPDVVAAPANCAVATVAAACRLAGPLDGAVVVVIGCGVLGLYACAMARSLGAAAVIGCDVVAARKDCALAFGAGHFVNPEGLVALCQSLTGGRGADVVIELSGASSSVALAIEVMRTGGTAVIAGTTTPCAPVELDPHLMMRRMLTLRGLHNYAPRDLVTAIDFLAENVQRLPLESLDGGAFRLEEIDAAFSEAARRPGTRVAVVP